EAPPLHDSRPEVLDDHVEARDESAHRVARALDAEVERDALLPAIVGLEVGGEAVRLQAVRASGLTAGLLDLHDLRAEVREEDGRHRTLLVPSEVEHTDAGQWPARRWKVLWRGYRHRAAPSLDGSSEP